MKNLITRKDKKKLRIIMLCHTGNPKCRKSKYSKVEWAKIREMYKLWLSVFGVSDMKSAKSVKLITQHKN